MTDEHAATIRRMRRSIRDHVTGLIAQGMEDGSFDPALNVSYVANSLFMSLNRATRWFHGGGIAPSVGAWHVQLFLEGIASEEWKDVVSSGTSRSSSEGLAEPTGGLVEQWGSVSQVPVRGSTKSGHRRLLDVGGEEQGVT